MNRYQLTKAGIDCNEGVLRFGGNKQSYEVVLRMFLEDDHFQSMVDAFACEDVEQAFAAAHALKGVAGNLSLAAVYADIVPLTEHLRAGDLGGALPFLPAVQASYATAFDAVERYTSNPEKQGEV